MDHALGVGAGMGDAIGYVSELAIDGYDKPNRHRLLRFLRSRAQV